MRQAGLVVHWLKMFRADAGRCVAKAKEITSFSPETSFAPLTLTNLHGAFVVLAVGYLAAFLVFIAEKIWFCLKKK